MIVIAKHVAIVKGNKEIHGTGSPLEDFLKNKKVDCFFIKHPIRGGLPSIIESHIRGIEKKERTAYPNSTFLPLKSLQELRITLQAINKIKEPIDLFVGIDPLNAFFGLLAKKRGKAKKVIFYTADYAIKRFNNPLMNGIYHWFDRYAIREADQVWNVSSRITELRKQQGVEEGRNFFVPNSIEFDKAKRLSFEEINRHDLVLVSGLTRAIDFSLIIKAIKKLSENYPDIKLLIIGEGEHRKELEELTRKLKTEKNILFLGRKDHQEVLEILSRSAIGIALYTEEFPWTKFGDSMKVREYLACGLPVIMTNVPSTSNDVKEAKAGFVIELKEKEFEKAINSLFSDQNLYLRMRKRAINLAKAYDFAIVIEKALSKLFLKRRDKKPGVCQSLDS